MSKIVITTTSFGEYDTSCLERCRSEGFDVVVNPYRRTVKPEELVELAKGAIGIIAGTEPITENVLTGLPQLKVISRCGAGVDNVDLKACQRMGIKIFSTPAAPTLAVAELTLGLILSLLRKVCQADNKVKSGKWQKPMGNLLSGKKVGIIGFGRIGRKLAELLEPFRCEIAYNDPSIEQRLSGFNGMPKEELLQWADIISLHVSTKDMILGEKELKLMKKGSWLINVSRGGTVDESALYSLLKEGQLSGAALDVFGQEPYMGLLKELDNVILTPHIGSYAKEARINMEREAVENLIKGLK